MSEIRNQDLPLLKVKDLHVYYGAIHAVKGISLEVHEGEIVTLIGANGAGKSTTLNTIAGLLKPRQGSIVLGGVPVDGTGASKMVFKGLSLCPEGRRIFQHMTVRENLEMGAYSRPNEEIEASLEDVFQDMLELAQCEKATQMLAGEIERTRRRVNALEYVMIPEMQETIRYITMKLEENERSTTTRLMKVKDQLLKEAHGYDY